MSVNIKSACGFWRQHEPEIKNDSLYFSQESNCEQNLHFFSTRCNLEFVHFIIKIQSLEAKEVDSCIFGDVAILRGGECILKKKNGCIDGLVG